MQLRGRRSAQLSLDDARIPRGRGGWRPRSGRPRGRKTCSHDARARFASRTPIHVTLRIAADVPSLRRSEAVAIVRDCIRASQRDDFRIIEFNTLATHIHLLVEADNAAALTEGMRSLGVRLARRLNRCFERRGALLAERYHARVLPHAKSVTSFATCCSTPATTPPNAANASPAAGSTRPRAPLGSTAGNGPS